MMIDKKLKNAFLNPKSIAIVGASANEKKTSARIQRFLVSHGYSGKIFPINPNREEVFGLKCYSSLTQITDQVDHVFIAVDGKKLFLQLKMQFLLRLLARPYFLEVLVRQVKREL